MASVSYGPALVSLLRGAYSSTVFTWAPPRSFVGKRKRGVRNRKVGRHSVPKLLARMDTIWRALAPSGKWALRKVAAANNYTNYVWFRRHVLNHQRRTGWKGPLALDLDTGYYIPMVDPAYAGGDIIELRWDDPDSSPRTMDLRNVAGQDVVMVQDAIHCELIVPAPETEYVHTHYWTWDMPPWWQGWWNLISGEGELHYEVQFSVPPLYVFDVHLTAPEEFTTHGMPDPPPWAKWSWVFTPTSGPVLSDSGQDDLW